MCPIDHIYTFNTPAAISQSCDSNHGHMFWQMFQSWPLLTGAEQRLAYYTNIECTGLNLPLRTEPFGDEPFVNKRKLKV
jgi:hypothetical protein